MTDARDTRLFLQALGLYFAAQVALRTTLGGTFEGDEAEMVMLAREWHFVIGSQPPLYNWVQTLSFDLFGVNTFGLILPKNLLLFATYALMFLALRRAAAPRVAMLGALSLALLPNLSWWAQRTGSHTIALVALTSATVLAFLHLAERRSLRAYLLFGLAVGLGGLAKPNYWMLPPALILAALSMAEFRAAVTDRRMLAGAALALAVVAGPYGWMLAHPAPTFSDTWEFYKGAEAAVFLPGLRGLASGAGESAAALLPLVLFLLVAALTGGRPMRRWPVPQGAAARLLLRAAGIATVLVALGVLFAGVTFVRSRWLLPVYMLAAPALTLAIFHGAGPRALRNGFRFFAVLALILLAGIADVRLRGAGSDSLRVDVLAERIEELSDPPPPIVALHYYTGNLALQRPGWRFLPPYPSRALAGYSGPVLLIDDKGSEASLLRRLAEHGVADPSHVRLGQPVTVTIPYRFEDEETRELRLYTARISPGNG